jgi:hypothetical protein
MEIKLGLTKEEVEEENQVLKQKRREELLYKVLLLYKVD